VTPATAGSALPRIPVADLLEPDHRNQTRIAIVASATTSSGPAESLLSPAVGRRPKDGPAAGGAETAHLERQRAVLDLRQRPLDHGRSQRRDPAQPGGYAALGVQATGPQRISHPLRAFAHPGHCAESRGHHECCGRRKAAPLEVGQQPVRRGGQEEQRRRQDDGQQAERGLEPEGAVAAGGKEGVDGQG